MHAMTATATYLSLIRSRRGARATCRQEIARWGVRDGSEPLAWGWVCPRSTGQHAGAGLVGCGAGAEEIRRGLGRTCGTAGSGASSFDRIVLGVWVGGLETGGSPARP
jgi:hypothetical protein